MGLGGGVCVYVRRGKKCWGRSPQSSCFSRPFVLKFDVSFVVLLATDMSMTNVKVA